MSRINGHILSNLQCIHMLQIGMNLNFRASTNYKWHCLTSADYYCCQFSFLHYIWWVEETHDRDNNLRIRLKQTTNICNVNDSCHGGISSTNENIVLWNHFLHLANFLLLFSFFRPDSLSIYYVTAHTPTNKYMYKIACNSSYYILCGRCHVIDKL